MRRWLAILLLVFLPFQFSWAAVASCCQHETDASSQHFGHHEHKHQADADRDGVPDSKLTGGIDNDCGTCHASCVVAIFAAGGLPLATSISLAIPWPPGTTSSAPLAEPERPNWSVLA
ncbi:MAG: cation efflux protein, CzcI family [Ferribacterium limneticum]